MQRHPAPGADAGTTSGRLLRLTWPMLALTAAVLLVDHWAQRQGWWGGNVGLVLRLATLLGLLAYLALRCAHFLRALEADLRAARALIEQPLHDSEREQAESLLLQGERKLHAIVESALDAAVRIDARGHVVGWNAQAEKTFGWSAREAAAQPLYELIIPPQYREAHVNGLRHYLATGEGPMLERRVELTALHRDGREFPIELAISPIVTPDGVEFSAFVRDISNRRQAEQARRALETQLRESQKMEAIGTLAGGIAHDFNNILAGILGNVALAREELAPGGVAGQSLEQIHKASLRARSLVQQILAFGRRQEQQLTPLPLQPVIEESHALLRAALPAGAVFDVHLTDEPVWVMADATSLQQVLMNLCTNAWHALGEKPGRIEVGLQPVDFAEAAPRPSGLAAGRHAHLWVCDSGRGMDAITRSRIFEPFFTTKPVGQGTGLGLSVVHGIVASHGGAITVDSTLGRGSCFHVYLPLCAAESAAAPLDAVAAEASRGQGQHVLYVDDDEVMVLLAGRLLKRAGYRVTSCQHAQQALALVREQPQAFDVVVSDYNMPDLSGGDLARALAAIRPDLPVVISSGHITAAMRAEATRAGVRALLHKENTFEELAGMVQRVLQAAPVHAGLNGRSPA